MSEMSCKTCGRWAAGWCLAQQLGTSRDEVCNAWELSWVVEWEDENEKLQSRIAELEAAQRWIPVSESPKECEMRVFKDGNAWCFVLPDFQDLQASPSVWMKKGVLDKIYKELRSVRNE